MPVKAKLPVILIHGVKNELQELKKAWILLEDAEF
jgi:hypothetical protein